MWRWRRSAQSTPFLPVSDGSKGRKRGNYPPTTAAPGTARADRQSTAGGGFACVERAERTACLTPMDYLSEADLAGRAASLELIALAVWEDHEMVRKALTLGTALMCSKAYTRANFWPPSAVHSGGSFISTSLAFKLLDGHPARQNQSQCETQSGARTRVDINVRTKTMNARKNTKLQYVILKLWRMRWKPFGST